MNVFVLLTFMVSKTFEIPDKYFVYLYTAYKEYIPLKTAILLLQLPQSLQFVP